MQNKISRVAYSESVSLHLNSQFFYLFGKMQFKYVLDCFIVVIFLQPFYAISGDVTITQCCIVPY